MCHFEGFPRSARTGKPSIYCQSGCSSFQYLSRARATIAGRFTPFSRHKISNFSSIFGAIVRFMRTRVLFSSTLTTSLQHNNTNYTPRQGKSGTRHTSPMGGCRSTPPWQRPPGRCCRTFAAPSRPPLAALGGALAGPVAPRGARGRGGGRGGGPNGRGLRRPPAATPPGGLAALAPGPLASPPAAASPLAPARPPAPVARGPGAPPGSPLRRLGGRRRAPGRGLAAPPPRCWRAGRAALWSGSRWSPSLRCALPACAPAPPRGPPPAPPLRGGCALRACPRSSRRGALRAAGAASPPSWRLRRAGGFPRRGCGWSVCGGSRGVRLRARDWRLRRWHLKRRPPCPRLERPAKPGHRQLPTSAHSRLCAGPRPAPYRCSKS